MSEPSGLRVCCRGKKEGTNKNSGKTEVENRTIRSEVLNTYSLYYLLSKSIGGNIYWQCNFQTETRQRECPGKHVSVVTPYKTEWTDC